VSVVVPIDRRWLAGGIRAYQGCRLQRDSFSTC
jgi:hypothetical protein